MKIAIVRRPQSTTPPVSSYGISCFLLKIAIVRGSLWTTPPPSPYGISCFFFEDSHRKRIGMDHPIPIFLWRILLPVEDIHGSGENNSLWSKYPSPYLEPFLNTLPMNMFHVKICNNKKWENNKLQKTIHLYYLNRLE